MKMIVGLGNPLKEYEYTRHNVGFMVLDYLGLDFREEKKFQAYISKQKIKNEDVIFVKPTTFMNLSGIAVAKISNYYHILPKDILIIQDDLDLPFGRFKIKTNSSSGGHNGIKSIIESLKTNSFGRLKIGISHNKDISTIDYVLGKFSKEDIDFLENSSAYFKDIINSFILNGIDKTMNDFN